MSIGDVPNLQAPVDLSQVTDTQLEQAAKSIKTKTTTPFSVDEIKSQLTHLKEHGIELDKLHIDNLKAGLPILTPSNISKDDVDKIEKLLKTNPFLRPNQLAAFNIIFLTLAYALSKIKLEEAQESSEATILMGKLASDVAKLIKQIGHTEMVAHIVSGVASFAKGAMSIGGAAWAARAKNQFQMQTRNMVVQGLGEITGSAGNFAQAWASATKATQEGMKLMTEKDMEAAQERGRKASEEEQKTTDLIAQVLQNWQKLVELKGKSGHIGPTQA